MYHIIQSFKVYSSVAFRTFKVAQPSPLSTLSLVSYSHKVIKSQSRLKQLMHAYTQTTNYRREIILYSLKYMLITCLGTMNKILWNLIIKIISGKTQTFYSHSFPRGGVFSYFNWFYILPSCVTIHWYFQLKYKYSPRKSVRKGQRKCLFTLKPDTSSDYPVK